MGLGQNFLTQVRLGQFLLLGLGRVIFGLGWKISPKNPKFFNLFLLGQKKSLQVGSKSTLVKDGSVSYLLQVKSMLGSGQGPSLFHTMKQKCECERIDFQAFYKFSNLNGLVFFKIT